MNTKYLMYLFVICYCLCSCIVVFPFYSQPVLSRFSLQNIPFTLLTIRGAGSFDFGRKTITRENVSTHLLFSGHLAIFFNLYLLKVC